MRVNNHVLKSILGGEVVTLLTRKLPNTQPILVGTAHFGHPFPWLVRFQISPKLSAWGIDPLNFFADVAVWSILIGIALLTIKRAKGSLGKQ